MAETKPTGEKKHITGARIAQEIKQYKKKFCGYKPQNFAFLYTFAVCNRKSIDKAETKRSGIAAPFRFMIES